MQCIPWEAIATAASGVTAVLAALFIGLRQVDITKKLAEIESNKLKFDLFDRRLKIFEIHSKLTSSTVSESQRTPFVADFMDRRSEVRFIYDAAVEDLFEEAYQVSVDLDFARNGTIEDFHNARNAASKNRAAFLDAVTPYLSIGKP